MPQELTVCECKKRYQIATKKLRMSDKETKYMQRRVKFYAFNEMPSIHIGERVTVRRIQGCQYVMSKKRIAFERNMKITLQWERDLWSRAAFKLSCLK